VFPGARVEVDFTDPELRWQGQGYFDTNSGGAPLEQDFNSWHWSRTHDSDGNVTVFYDRISSDLDRNCLALEIAADGCVTSVTAPPEVRLPNTGLWKIARSTRGDFGQHQPRIKTLEDTPFYARTQIEFEQSGKPVIAVHESLSMTRFTNPLVQLMLPFKMPRWASKQD
jgi:carotenoid 1,2-hydratase